MNGKKGSTNLLSGSVIFIVLNVLFFSLMLLFISYKSNDVSVYEQVYAKQIALMIDSAKPGTNLSIDMGEMYSLATKNKLDGISRILDIDNDNKRVTVHLTNGKGYVYYFFTDSKVKWMPDKEDKKLYLEVLK